MKKHKARVRLSRMTLVQAKIHLSTKLVGEPWQTKNYSHLNFKQISQHRDNFGKGLKKTNKYLKNSQIQIMQLA